MSAEGTARWQAVEELRDVIYRYSMRRTSEHYDATPRATAALSLLEQLLDEAEDVCERNPAHMHALRAALDAVHAGRSAA